MESNELVGDATADVSRPVRSFGLESLFSGITSFGGRYDIRTRTGIVDVARGDFTVALAPRYRNEVAARWTQPLRRDLGRTANAGQIERERLNATSVGHQGTQQLLALVLDIHTRYWTLVLRREEARIRHVNVQSAIQLREIVGRRVAAGSDAASSIVQADAAVAERRQAVNLADLAIIDAESDLLRVSFLTRAGVIGPGDLLLPSEAFGDVKSTPTFEAELKQAKLSRPEVKQAEQDLRRAELDLRIAENRTRWRVDLYGEAGVLGIAGTPRTGVIVPTALSGGFVTTFGNSLSSPFVEVGLQLEIPFDNGDAEGAARQAELRVKRQRAVDVETQLTVDIRAALQRLAVARRSLDVAKRALELAEEHVAGQERRYAGGGKILFDVIQAQDQRSEAEAELALARAQHELALASVEAARGTLLEKFGPIPQRTR